MIRSTSNAVPASRDEHAPTRQASAPPVVVDGDNVVSGTLKVELVRNAGETLGIGIAGRWMIESSQANTAHWNACALGSRGPVPLSSFPRCLTVFFGNLINVSAGTHTRHNIRFRCVFPSTPPYHLPIIYHNTVRIFTTKQPSTRIINSSPLYLLFMCATADCAYIWLAQKQAF
jgi:hypothetical protein